MAGPPNAVRPSRRNAMKSVKVNRNEEDAGELSIFLYADEMYGRVDEKMSLCA